MIDFYTVHIRVKGLISTLHHELFGALTFTLQGMESWAGPRKRLYHWLVCMLVAECLSVRLIIV